MTYDPKKLCFTDCETTGLDTRRHDAWEIAMIYWNGTEWEEKVWRLWPPALQEADTVALSTNKFYERTVSINSESNMADKSAWDSPNYVAEEIAYITAGRHLVGACPWFDARFYEKLLLANAYTPAWHYHLIDVEALSIGYISRWIEVDNGESIDLPLPWKTDWLAVQLGIERPASKDRHTALGDAREVKDIFEYIMGDYTGHSIEHGPWDIEEEEPAGPATLDLKIRKDGDATISGGKETAS